MACCFGLLQKDNAASQAANRLNKELWKKRKHKSKSSPLMRNHNHPIFAHLTHDAFLRLDCNPRSDHLGYNEEALRKNIRLHYNTKLGKRFRRNFQVSLAKLVAEGKLIPHDTEEDGILYLPTQNFVEHFKRLKIPHQYLSHRRFASLLKNQKHNDTESLFGSPSPSIPTSRRASIPDLSSSRSPSGRWGRLDESPVGRPNKSKRDRPNITPAAKSKDKPSKSLAATKKKDKTSKSKNKNKPNRSRRGSIVDLGVEDQPNKSQSRQRSKVDLAADRREKPGQKHNKTPDRRERGRSRSRERPSGDRRAKKRKSVEPNKSKSPSGGTHRRNESPSRARSRGGRGRGKAREKSQSPLSSRSDDSRRLRTQKRGKLYDRDSKSRSPGSRSYLSKWLWGDSGSSKHGKGSRGQKSKQPRSKSPSSRSTSKDRSRSPKMSKRPKRGRSPSLSQSPKRSRQRSKGVLRSLKRSKPVRKRSGSHSRSPKRKPHESKSPSQSPKGSKPKRSRSPQRRRARSPSSGYKAYGSGYRLSPKRRPNFRRTSSPGNYVSNHYVDDGFDDSTILQDEDEENQDDYEDITDDGNDLDESLNNEILGDGGDMSDPPGKNNQNSRNLFQRLGDSIRNAFGGVSGTSRTSSGAMTPLQHRHDHPASRISTSNLTPPRSPRNRPKGHALSHNPRSPRGKPKPISNDPRSPRGGSAERLSDNPWSMRSRVDYSPPSPRSRDPKHTASTIDPEFEPNEWNPHGSKIDSIPNESMPFSARLANLLRE